MVRTDLADADVTGAEANADRVVARLAGITKSFGPTAVLQGVTLELRAGEVHVLAGENGAGKSTLIKVLAGVHAPDGGEVVLDGSPVRFSGPGEARRAGIAVVHQELSLVSELTVADNLVLGREPRRRGGRLDRREAHRRAVAALARVGAHIDPDARVGALGTGEQQLVEIARALSEQPRLLVFDEPTAALSDEEAARLLHIIAELRAAGLALLYITHRMAEIARIADRVTVLRDGRVADVMTRAEMTEDRIVTAMVGRQVESRYRRGRRGGTSNVRLRVTGLASDAVHPATFDVRAGEVVGLAGIVGAGRSELCRLVAGADRPSSGQVEVDGRPVDLGSPTAAMAAGVVMLPESRKAQGLFLDMSVAENVCLGTRLGRRRLGRTSPAARRAAARPLTERMRVRAAGLDQRIGDLSGGNQQKVLLARCLARSPAVLLLDEPTRGVDIGAKVDIYALINDVAGQGVAVLLVSSELPELLGLADRVLVMCERRIVAELAGDDMTEEQVMRYATGSVPPSVPLSAEPARSIG